MFRAAPVNAGTLLLLLLLSLLLFGEWVCVGGGGEWAKKKVTDL